MSVNVMGKDEVLVAVKNGEIMAFIYDPDKKCLKEIDICAKDGGIISSIGVINEPPR